MQRSRDPRVTGESVSGAGGGRISNKPLSSSTRNIGKKRRQSPNSSSNKRGPAPPPASSIPPPPGFKPPPLPEEDDGCFIRPIGRSRSPHLNVPPVPVSLSPIGEVDTPESSRSVSPCSMMSHSSSSSRAYSPSQPYLISHDSFIKNSSPQPPSGQPSWRRKSPVGERIPELALSKPTEIKPPGSPVRKPLQNVGTTRGDGEKRIRKDTPAITSTIPRMEINPATPMQGRQKENADQKRIKDDFLEEEEMEEPAEKASKFDIDGKFTGSNFKRRQSKKFKINRDMPQKTEAVKETLKVPLASDSSVEEDYDLESKNLTAKEEFVIKEVLNARRSRSRSPNVSEASFTSTDTSSAAANAPAAAFSAAANSPSAAKATKAASTTTNLSAQKCKESTPVPAKSEGIDTSDDMEMTSVVQVKQTKGGIFVPDCVENIADLTVEHIKFMSDTVLAQADVNELGDYYETGPVKNIPQVVIDKAETRAVPKNLARANVNARDALISDVDKMYEDVIPGSLSPLPQPKQVSIKKIDGGGFAKAAKTPKDVAITDLTDEAMEVEETEFETLDAKRAKEQKTISNLHKVGQEPQPSLVTDIYEKTEMVKERTPDQSMHEYEAVIRNVSSNKVRAEMAPQDALVGDVNNTFETAAEAEIQNGVQRSQSAAHKSEPNKFTTAQKTSTQTASLGAENKLKANFDEKAADLSAENITSPKFAVKQSVTKTLKTASKCIKDTQVTNINQQFTIAEETKLSEDTKVYSTVAKDVASPLKKASASVKDTPVTEIHQQFTTVEETKIETANKVYSTAPKVETGFASVVASNSEQVALYEDIEQPKPRAKKLQLESKAEVKSQPELSRASKTGQIVVNPRNTSQQPPKTAVSRREEPPKRSVSSHPERYSWQKEEEIAKFNRGQMTAVERTKDSSSSMITWLIPSLLGVAIYWVFQLMCQKVERPEPIGESLEDYSYFNILRWP